jgi:2-(1,2-epoxy-1,2-dihydrophenyl)acetyl-CoA isomerase
MADSDKPTVLTAQEGGVLTIAFNRPEVLNALNERMVAELGEALKIAERDAAIRCVVLTGSGRGFSSGQDLAAFLTLRGEGGGGSIREHLKRGYNRIILRMRGLEKPIIAGVNGAAAGVGLSIALAADMRIAADNASFTTGFSRIGLAPDGGMSFMLPLLVGLGRAAELAFTADRIDATEAHRLGLVNRVVPAAALGAATGALAAQLAGGPTRALGLTKRAFNRALLPDLETLLDYEAHIQEIAGRTADHREGVDAFLNKRPAHFTGQ